MGAIHLLLTQQYLPQKYTVIKHGFEHTQRRVSSLRWRPAVAQDWPGVSAPEDLTSTAYHG